MSENVKCGICGTVVEGEDCQLMTVVINEDGKETKICCTHQIPKEECNWTASSYFNSGELVLKHWPLRDPHPGIEEIVAMSADIEGVLSTVKAKWCSMLDGKIPPSPS